MAKNNILDMAKNQIDKVNWDELKESSEIAAESLKQKSICCRMELMNNITAKNSYTANGMRSFSFSQL